MGVDVNGPTYIAKAEKKVRKIQAKNPSRTWIDFMMFSCFFISCGDLNEMVTAKNFISEITPMPINEAATC
jgi:hypothetical protein